MDDTLLTTIIYDDEEIRVIWAPGVSTIAIITFGDLIRPAKDHHFFADGPLKKLQISAVGVMSKRGNWYPRENIQLASRNILRKTAGYETCIVYGGSMGGYAALKYSNLLGATHVVALCPQWSIDPLECHGFDPGWTDYFTSSMRGMGIRASDVAGKIFLFADPLNARDWFHCKMIIENCPEVHFISVPMVDHHVTTVFAGTPNLQLLLDACCTGDITALRSISRRIRKNHPIWQRRWLHHAIQKFPHIGINFLLNPENRGLLRDDRRYFTYVLGHLSRKVSPDRAVAFYSTSWSLLSNPPEQHLICSYLVSVAGGNVAITTERGSCLMYDLAENRAVHKVAPLNPWDIPVEVEFLGSAVVLFVTIGGTRFRLSSADNGWLDLTEVDKRREGRFLFEIRKVGSGQFTISQGGKYLSAEGSGRVLCNRDSAKAWEMFHFSSHSAAEMHGKKTT